MSSIIIMNVKSSQIEFTRSNASTLKSIGNLTALTLRRFQDEREILTVKFKKYKTFSV